MQIKSIDRMIIRYFSIYFLSSLMIFLSISLLFSFLQIINNRDIVKGCSFILLLKSIVYLIPSVITSSIMFSAVFSVFFTVGDMSSRGEMIAIRCSGYSYERVAEKIVLIAIVLIPFLYLLNHTVVPGSRIKSRQALRMMINRATNINLRSGLFERVSSSRIIAEEIGPSSLKGINIVRKELKEFAPNKKIRFIAGITATNGTYIKLKEKGILFSLNKGRISLIDTENPNIFYVGSFSNYQTFLPFEMNEKRYELNLKFMTTKQIIDDIKNNRIIDITKAQKEIQSRTASAISLLALVLLSLVLSFLYERESKYFSFAASIAIIFSYYALEIVSNYMFSKKIVNTPTIVYLPLIVIICLGFYFYKERLKNK
ncbi:MAG: LptF/LptG family permease [Elusimicrobiales bacterium]